MDGKTHQGPDSVRENMASSETTPYRSIQDDNKRCVLNDLGRTRKKSRMQGKQLLSLCS